MKNVLSKLNSRIGKSNDGIEAQVDERVSDLLDDHLDMVAAAHHSTHGDHHGSTPPREERNDNGN